MTSWWWSLPSSLLLLPLLSPLTSPLLSPPTPHPSSYPPSFPLLLSSSTVLRAPFLPVRGWRERWDEEGEGRELGGQGEEEGGCRRREGGGPACMRFVSNIAPHTLHDPCVLVLDWFVVFLPYNRVFLENVIRCFEALHVQVQQVEGVVNKLEHKAFSHCGTLFATFKLCKSFYARCGGHCDPVAYPVR